MAEKPDLTEDHPESSSPPAYPPIEPCPSWSSKVLCRYFLHGVCGKGAECHYSHDLGSKPASVCRYYQQGKCTYGDKCRFDHVKYEPRDKFSLSASKMSHSREAPKLQIITNLQPTTSKMTTLGKKNQSEDSGLGDEAALSPLQKNPDAWVKAAEFVPGQVWQGSAPTSYSKAAQSGLAMPDGIEDEQEEFNTVAPEIAAKELCPFAAHGECRYGENCAYMHGDECEWCGRLILHPTDNEQRVKHQEECLKEHEEDMELSFAVARSKDKTCGICMDLVMEKNPPSDRRFGILSNCPHCFCLPCIRKWRAAKQFEHKIVRACPECRVTSDFVTPSKYWIEDEEEKKKLITGYKQALSMKPCKYFDEGRGECPFNENCFYRHAYPDGRAASPKPRRRRRRTNANGDLDFIQQMILWDFFEDRENNVGLTLDLEDVIDDILFHAELLDISSDSSDFSDDSFYL